MLFFADDAVVIKTTLHQRLADKRVNLVNPRREFFHATPAEVKGLLGELAGDLLHFEDFPEALEHRQSVAQRGSLTDPPLARGPTSLSPRRPPPPRPPAGVARGGAALFRSQNALSALQAGAARSGPGRWRHPVRP